MTSADIDRIESLPEWARGHAYRLTFAGLRWKRTVHGLKVGKTLITETTTPADVRGIIADRS